ncbi:M56 family metallopeptidase [Streptomyces katrae]|uniref:M56 family metallopeptidase n=1 Tax=Streptomyces katrae TaxID=68223 RepID=UPI000695A8D8|nr:M56 family metallopeptidase [Streptomyces katrae]
MNHHVLPPLGLALVTGLVLPWMLVRAVWAQQAPRLGLAVWILCGALFAASTAMLPAQLLLPAQTSHRLVDMALTLDPPSPGRVLDATPREALAALAALAVLAVPGTGFVRELARARRARTRHAELLRLVGRYDRRLGVTVLEDPRPAVYCLPGRSRRVVVSTGALEVLSEQELAAALAHERAHIGGRHHLMVAAAGAYASVFRRLPLARIGGRTVPLCRCCWRWPPTTGRCAAVRAMRWRRPCTRWRPGTRRTRRSRRVARRRRCGCGASWDRAGRGFRCCAGSSRWPPRRPPSSR